LGTAVFFYGNEIMYHYQSPRIQQHVYYLLGSLNLALASKLGALGTHGLVCGYGVGLGDLFIVGYALHAALLNKSSDSPYRLAVQLLKQGRQHLCARGKNHSSAPQFYQHPPSARAMLYFSAVFTDRA
jgi:hypothetical protein